MFKRSIIRWCVLLLCLGFFAVPAAAVGESTFRNPVLADGADPWLQYHRGNYYMATTTWSSQVVMRKAPTLAGLRTAAPLNVWSETDPSRCCNSWAPEFHRLNGPNGFRWYLTYTSGSAGTLDNQRLNVLESAGDDPMGPYTRKSSPVPTGWNIDGSYMTVGGQLYLLWSEFDGPDQSLWIAKMSNPWTITGSRVLISRPTLAWETVGGRVNEGPVVLQRGGRTFLVYSASACATPDYKLGMLTLTGADPLVPASWTKGANPIFQQAAGAYGPGHNGFFTSPDGTENWIVYHANASSSQGCGRTRSTRAQKFTWNADGTPNLGTPAATTTDLAVPSGERGPSTASVLGAAYTVVNRNSGLCLAATGTADGANVVQDGCGAAAAVWVLDSTADGYYRLVNRQTNRALDAANCGTANGTDVRQWAWLDNVCQQWQVSPTSDGWFRLDNRNSGKTLDVANCGTGTGVDVRQWSWLGNACQEWRLQPSGTVAIASTVSGRVLDVANCSTASTADVRQWSWQGTACQKWTFTHTDGGHYRVVPAHNPNVCLEGTNVVQGTCTEWRVDPLADGTVRLVARQGGEVLDLAECGLGDGTDVRRWAWLDNACQRFTLRPV